MSDKVLNTPLDVTLANPIASQSVFICTILTIETPEQGVLYVNNKDSRTTPFLYPLKT